MVNASFAVRRKKKAVAKYADWKRLVALSAVAVTMLASAIDKTYAQSANDNSTQREKRVVRIYPFRLKHEVPKTGDSQSQTALASGSPISPGPPGAHLTYYGGPVVSNVQIVVVMYGSGSYLSDLTQLPNFFTALTNGTFMDMLSEYSTQGVSGAGGAGSTNQLIQHGTYLTTVDITPSPANDGPTIDDSNIQNELVAQIQAGHLLAPSYDANGNPDTVYMLYFPQGKTITQGGSSSCVAGGFCAYHGTLTLNNRDVLYGVQPDMQAGSGCNVGCGNASTEFGNYTAVASHEFSEAITDAAVGLATTFAPPLAWYDQTNGEIGDICNGIQGQADGYTVQAEWSNLQNGCAVGPVALQTSGPGNATTGTRFNVTVTAKDSSGSNLGSAYLGTVHFTSTDTAAALPADYTFVTSDSGSHTFSATLNTSGSQTIHVNDVRATGFKGSTTVSVTASGSPDFTISASPSSLSIAQGTSGTSTISTTTVGSPGTVGLSVSGVPSGASASLSRTSVTSGSNSTLTVNAGSAALGTYTLTVTGTEGSATHSTTVTVTVTSPPLRDFTISASPSSMNIQQGTIGTSTISTSVVGSSGTVSLNVSGVPSGASASLNLTSVTAGNSSTLTVNAGSAALGTYTLTVTGTEGSATHSANVSVTITAPSPPNFTIAASPTSLSIQQGGSSTSTISTAVVGSAGSVSLTASVNPAGPIASLNPTSVAAGSSSTLTVSVGGSVATGSYTVTVTGTEGSNTHSTTLSVTVTTASVIVNGGFETGNLGGWTSSGTTSVTSPGHTGNYAAMLGSTNPTNGDSSISQTFTVPAAGGTLSFWYKVNCPDTVNYDWATATLTDHTSGSTVTLLSRTCIYNGPWTQVSYSLSGKGGHNVTLTLVSHDDNYPGDPTYTLYDDVQLTPSAAPGPLTNGGFETGNLSGWTSSGTASVTSPGHTGNYAAMLGSTNPTSGDSSISQTFNVPASAATLSFWYRVNCPDTVTYDWATATLIDNTSGTTVTLLSRTCIYNGPWTQVSYSLSGKGGHSVTLTLVSHDDNYPGDPTYTLYDDVAVQ